jgi:hypothetical protein
VTHASGTGEYKSVSSTFSAEIQTAIRAELEMILEAPSFTQSNRCKSFLSFVVLQTLSGHAAELKERTIGIGVFDRAMDYDTGGDSIVRVTSNEVRKRISQFYAESTRSHSIQIDLPRGSYVPEFRIQPSRRSRRSDEPAPSLDYSDQVAASVETPGPKESIPTTPVFPDSGLSDKPAISANEVLEVRPARKTWVYASVLILLLVCGVTTFSVWKIRAQRTVPQVFEAFLHPSVPVLICIDTHSLHLRNASSPDGQRFVDLVLYKQIISLDDAAVLSSMAAGLGRKGIPFRVVGAEQTSLAEFRRQPVILIGAIDNKWTIRLTQSLRYRIEVANPPGSGSDKEPIATIVDSRHPENSPWTVDLAVPFAAWKNDYAIVARMDVPTTGVPVLIEAGLGNDGSIAASELITSAALTDNLANEASCRGKSNFEAVIGTEIIDTKSGPPHVLRLECW